MEKKEDQKNRCKCPEKNMGGARRFYRGEDVGELGIWWGVGGRAGSMVSTEKTTQTTSPHHPGRKKAKSQPAADPVRCPERDDVGDETEYAGNGERKLSTGRSEKTTNPKKTKENQCFSNMSKTFIIKKTGGSAGDKEKVGKLRCEETRKKT